MPLHKARTWLCLCGIWLSACRGCESKTPVPFKRAGLDASTDAQKPAEAAQADESATIYPEGTQKIVLGETTIERRAGQIRASVMRDLNEDQKPDVLLIESDDEGRARLEVLANGTNQASGQLVLNPEPLGRGCRSVAASLALLGSELGMASVDFLCDTPAAPSAAPIPADPTADLPPPEPDEEVALTEHFVFSLSMRPQQRLRLAADWSAENEPISPELLVSAADVDGDQLEDLQIAVQRSVAEKPSKDPAAEQPPLLTLIWLSRTTGLARERQEPEATLRTLASEASKLLTKKPAEASARASQALALHRLLCREGGGARLWIDEARGVSCGASGAAGKALATVAIAQARQQRLLPALEARSALDNAAYAVDRTTREQVTAAIGAIRGDTSYHWQQGPAQRSGSAPNLRLPAIGFIDDDHVLLRGPVAQSFDLGTRVSTPIGLSGSQLAGDSAQRFVLTDIVHGCDGYRVRVVPAGAVVGGIVTGAVTSEPLLLQEQIGPEAAGCTPGSRARSDHGGYVLLGLSSSGALFARGKHLWLLPLDGRGEATGPARELAPGTPIPPLQTPGALDPSARYMALASSEGVTVIDRVQDSARLIRSPASCAGGQVTDAVISPSGRKLAMLCAGRVYVAEPAAESGTVDRPISEHP